MKKIIALVIFLTFLLAGCDQYSASGLDDNSSSNSSTDSSYYSTSADSADSSEASTDASSEELSPSDEMVTMLSALIDSGKAFDAGNYAPGDIPVGEYAFIPFSGSDDYFGEEKTNGDIIDNENFDSFGYVYVSGKGNIETGAALVNPKDFKTLGVKTAKELYEKINDTSDYKDSAMYKVGVDIKPGTYKLKGDSDAYVEVLSGPVGKGDIVNNDNFNGRYNVSVSNGQYLNISNASIIK